MSSISIETKKITDLDIAAAADASENDLLILRLSDGSGVKVMTVSVLRSIITGSLSGLNTIDQSNIVAAINEIVATVTDHAEWLEDLPELLDHFGIANAGFSNSLYRGKYLGSSVTSDQYNEIDGGTFKDIFVGDYWTINGVKYRVGSLDYWFGMGDTACSKHHALIVPDSNLVSGINMNSTNTTTGAYVGSDYYTGSNGNTGKASAQTIIEAAFSAGNILTHREYLANAVTDGCESTKAWYDSTFELMTEEMVYGGREFGNVLNGTSTIPKNHTIGMSQIPLFAHDRSLICNRANWWLRDVASAANFADVGGYGYCNCNFASYTIGIRPDFGIKKS